MATADELAAKAAAAQARADRLTAEAERKSEGAHHGYDRFAGGQPLLVGHHSYRSAVRDRRRADAASDRALDAYKAAQAAQREAAYIRARAEAKAEITKLTNAKSRPWEPADFRPGDIVTVRVFETSTSTYPVKRVNQKTLTLDGGGGGFDDPKRTYDRVLSRTRDGITVTDPAAN